MHSPSVTVSVEPATFNKMKSYSQMSAVHMTPHGVLDILDDKFVEGNGQNVRAISVVDTGDTPMSGSDEDKNDDDLYRKGSNIITSGNETADDTDDGDEDENQELYSSKRKMVTPE